MLKIKLLTVGDKMPTWVNEGTREYINRIRGNTRVELVEVPAQKRGKNADISRILSREGEAILKQVPAGSKLICLDRQGRAHDSLAFADKLLDWQQSGQSINFVIGGPEGIGPALLSGADEKWTLSEMTFTHHVARVMLAEQLYRAWSITEGLPYHR
ncbi:MAG: 23S rRNA (pseudouridine(1915)-N(3))-methyltransferase RlmH [Proteobacteria bacterium]|nr:23S rRNA (pseudouridine(1915)-N(3))-methyltransferase RlmH [Pseudomonadota bacterium]